MATTAGRKFYESSGPHKFLDLLLPDFDLTCVAADLTTLFSKSCCRNQSMLSVSAALFNQSTLSDLFLSQSTLSDLFLSQSTLYAGLFSASISRNQSTLSVRYDRFSESCCRSQSMSSIGARFSASCALSQSMRSAWNYIQFDYVVLKSQRRLHYGFK